MVGVWWCKLFIITSEKSQLSLFEEVILHLIRWDRLKGKSLTLTRHDQSIDRSTLSFLALLSRLSMGRLSLKGDKLEERTIVRRVLVVVVVAVVGTT